MHLLRSAVIVTLVIQLFACAQPKKNAQPEKNEGYYIDPADAALAGMKLIDLRNSICPVTGTEIQGKGSTSFYHLQWYHLSNDDSRKEFEKNPEKYARLVEANPSKFGVSKVELKDTHRP